MEKGVLYSTGWKLGQAVKSCTEITPTKEKDEVRQPEFGVLNLYPDVRYQTIEGFGGAMMEASAYLLASMDPEKRKEVIDALFSDKGNGLRYLRVSIDSCDFTLGEYQAVEHPDLDPELKTFSLKRDKEWIIPILKEIMEVRKDLSVMLSPWSPPSCWKTPAVPPRNDGSVYGGMPEEILSLFDFENPTRTAGTLKPEFYGNWARYIVKYISAYLEEGIPVTMMSLQNESNAATFWDSCVWTAEQQKVFLRDHLYPEIEKAGLAEAIEIYIWDHNKERVVEFSEGMLDDETLPMIAGIAFHWYSGDHFEAVDIIKDRYPGKTLLMSECCGMLPMGGPAYEMTTESTRYETFYYNTAINYAHDIIGNINNGMNRWLEWCLLLDDEGRPRHVPGGCTSPVIVHKDFSYTLDPIYEFTGHFSKYIKPGAVRIGFSRCDDHVEMTSAKNPDGSIAVILLNKGMQDREYILRFRGLLYRIYLNAQTISTLVIPEAEAC